MLNESFRDWWLEGDETGAVVPAPDFNAILQEGGDTLMMENEDNIEQE